MRRLEAHAGDTPTCVLFRAQEAPTSAFTAVSTLGESSWSSTLSCSFCMMMMMMMTFITRRGEGQGKTKKERKATKSKGRGLEEGASRALMRQHGEEGCGERG